MIKDLSNIAHGVSFSLRLLGATRQLRAYIAAVLCARAVQYLIDDDLSAMSSDKLSLAEKATVFRMSESVITAAELRWHQYVPVPASTFLHAHMGYFSDDEYDSDAYSGYDSEMMGSDMDSDTYYDMIAQQQQVNSGWAGAAAAAGAPTHMSHRDLFGEDATSDDEEEKGPARALQFDLFGDEESEEDDEAAAAAPASRHTAAASASCQRTQVYTKSAYLFFVDEARPAYLAEHPELKGDMSQSTKMRCASALAALCL